MKLNLTLHDAKKELPKESCDVIALWSDGNGVIYSAMDVKYSNKYKKFNCFDGASEEHAKKHSINVDYWAEMPKKVKGKRNMKKTICAWVFGICLFLIIGIFGGVECGQPLSNLFWCLPLALTAVVSAVIGEFGF